MAWPFLNGVIKVVVTFGFDGEPSVNVHFVLMRSPASPIPTATLALATNAFHAGLDTNWKAEMGTEWQVDNITATDWSQEDGEQVVTALGLPIVGLEANEEVPASVCMVVSHRTDRTGRSRRGRTYLPGLTEGNVGGNDVDAGATAAGLSAFTTTDASLDASELDHVVYSLVSGGAPRVTPIATLITSRICNTRVDTQRRRLPV